MRARKGIYVSATHWGEKMMNDGRKCSVVIVDDEPILRMDLSEMLEMRGYEVVGEAGDGYDAISVCREKKPDLVFMDIKMPLLDGLSATEVICDEKLTQTVILLTAYTDHDYIEKAKACGIGVYLVKPINESALEPTIEMARNKTQVCQQLEKKVENITNRLKSRIVIEKSKGWLMQKGNLSEEKAYNYLREISQEKNIPMVQVAQFILRRAGIGT